MSIVQVSKKMRHLRLTEVEDNYGGHSNLRTQIKFQFGPGQKENWNWHKPLREDRQKELVTMIKKNNFPIFFFSYLNSLEVNFACQADFPISILKINQKRLRFDCFLKNWLFWRNGCISI